MRSAALSSLSCQIPCASRGIIAYHILLESYVVLLLPMMALQL